MFFVLDFVLAFALGLRKFFVPPWLSNSVFSTVAFGELVIPSRELYISIISLDTPVSRCSFISSNSAFLGLLDSLID